MTIPPTPLAGDGSKGQAAEAVGGGKLGGGEGGACAQGLRWGRGLRAQTFQRLMSHGTGTEVCLALLKAL